MTTRLPRLLSVMTALAAIAVVSGCGSSSSGGGGAGDSGRIPVVAAENFWGDIAKQIGGTHVEVTSIISDPNADPHLFESDPRDAAALSGAKLVIENGVGYDDFMDKLLATDGGSRRVLSVQKVLGVTASDANPHLWYWTARLHEVAQAISQQLGAIDPTDAKDFAAAARRFDASLKPLLDTIATIKRKYAGTKIAYTERVPGYLVAACGLKLGMPPSFAQALEAGNDPSPQDTAAFEASISAHAVDVLLYNSQVVDAQTTRIKQLANRAKVPVVGVSETLPQTYPDFQAWQLAQARALLEALGG
ncbi:MAG TPA: zinc ABC transporter substrate-binding protein [Mycobacteriales bacterium]|nr:zinc ABC transporter substrate-binding protein [Mycobacteriales bacterium]